MKLNRILAVVATVAALLALGGVAFLISTRNSAPASTPDAAAVATTAPTTTSPTPTVYCEDEANSGAVLTAGCVQENGAIYAPIPDSVGTDFTCYGYAMEAFNDAQTGVNDLNARDWYVASSDFDIARAGFQTIEDHTTGPISIRAHNARVMYYWASDDILRGAIRGAYKMAQFGNHYAQQVIALATDAGTSCTIPALAGIGIG
jgi:hypothetical protein